MENDFDMCYVQPNEAILSTYCWLLAANDESASATASCIESVTSFVSSLASFLNALRQSAMTRWLYLLAPLCTLDRD